MNRRPIIKETKEWVRNQSFGEGTGHDWFHVQRVVDLAVQIGTIEKADLFTVEMGALLHDVDDPKITNKPMPCKHNPKNPTLVFLAEIGLTVMESHRIWDVIGEVSFSKNKDRKPSSIEAAVVQDADRLDAIGAVGIARCFAYGGSKGRMIYNPADLLDIKTSKVVQSVDEPLPPSSLLHFYEKLLLVKDLMNTAEGKRLAEGRHQFLETYLDQFFAEWNGVK